ncbi:Uncharacterized protein FWK35_00034598 [Aphis craccivora]|uniref:Uncharacterized protein n=1 Tax=Aphis craccivora TaxID=307492 RepID=A0A6G0VMX7_APHCR|nr:Uncharacterized protein FWK35_00034598 [Aphis craccivora]
MEPPRKVPRSDTLSYNLRFEGHVRSTIKKERGARAALYPILNRNSAVPISARLSIYKIYARPIILYAAPVWRNHIGPAHVDPN